MINPFKPIRSNPQLALLSSSLPVRFNRKAFAARLGRKTLSSSRPASVDMDKADSPSEKTDVGRDLMWSSFGEAYATRSDEEGFGGIYGQSQRVRNDEEIDETHPANEKSSGSEVKGEKAGHQTHQANT